MSAYVQGVWTGSVAQDSSSSVEKWLQGDACSGIWFNLGEPIYLDDIPYFEKVTLQPVSKQARPVVLPPGASLAGIRFQPGVGFGVFGKHFEAPSNIVEGPLGNELNQLADSLASMPGYYRKITALYKWIKGSIDFSEVIPVSFMKALNEIQETGSSKSSVYLGQRQLERLCNQRMGMTPKQFHRIRRVKAALTLLKENPRIDLVQLALDGGFSDQAHMTREFKQIAKITPGQYSKML